VARFPREEALYHVRLYFDFTFPWVPKPVTLNDLGRRYEALWPAGLRRFSRGPPAVAVTVNADLVEECGVSLQFVRQTRRAVAEFMSVDVQGVVC